MTNYKKYIKIQAESLEDIRELVAALSEFISWDTDPKYMIGRVPNDFYCYLSNPEVIYDEHN